ncbi:MAG: SGNH/GDSL hydrolase family protein [Ramlibacter sp.]|nr:SGNH/GDSL hydrolase family protein [Ramlibacter sp.]
MSRTWMRRGLLALASASALFLAACGSGSIESQFQPSRAVAFGDGFTDQGTPANRYTVNDLTSNIWAQQLALSYGIFLDPATVAGGTNYARGNARVNTKPDAAGNSATPTVKEQVEGFLATQSFGANDLVIIGAGIGDIVAEASKVTAGTQSREQMIANVQQAGRDYGALIRRMVQAGAQHIAVTGTYDLSRSPWAISIGQTALLSDASIKYNTEMLVSIVDLGANVLYLDGALLFNLMTSSPSSYGFSTVVDAACTSVDPGPGIGIGAGQVNSSLCTPNTIVSGASYTNYMFADKIYPTPGAHRTFGDYAYQRVRSRW